MAEPEAPNDSELLIRKVTVPVEIATGAAKTLTGEVFLRPQMAAERGERLLDLVAQRWFLPVKIDGTITFVAVRHIHWIKLDLLAAVDELDAEAQADEHSSRADVRVQLADASRLVGNVRYSLPENRSRLGDFLERLPPFLALTTADFVYLVNATCVVSVTALEEQRR